MKTAELPLEPRFPALDALRAATRAMHLRLHHEPRFAALAAGVIDRAGYRDLLERLYGFHASLETRLFTPAPWPSHGYRPRPRAHLIADDLAAIGLSPREIARLPCAGEADLPALTPEGAHLGCHYVRDGATIGCRLLASALDPLLGGETPDGRRFLSGEPGDRQSWRDCRAALEAGGRAGWLPAMIAGACGTFTALDRWLHGNAAYGER